MRRALSLGLLLLATAANATAATATTNIKSTHPLARANVNQKPQWAPSGKFFALHTRTVFREKTRDSSHLCAREKSETAAAKRNTLHPDGTRQSEVVNGIQRKYNYDASGALAAVINVSSGDTVASWAHLQDGRVSARTVNGVSSTYAWDAFGRLVSATTPAGTMAFEYDGLGMRRKSSGLSNANYTWVGESQVAEGNQLLASVGPYLLAQGPVRFSHDALGSIVSQYKPPAPPLLEAASQNQFGTWGLPLGGTQLTSNSHTGHRFEEKLGLIDSEQRWRDVNFGVWLSKDELGAHAYLQTPNAIGSWSYASHSPARYVDLDGRRPQTPEEVAEIAKWQSALAEIRSKYDALPIWNQALAFGYRSEIGILERNIRQRSDAIERAQPGRQLVMEGMSIGLMDNVPLQEVAGELLPVFPAWFAPDSVDAFEAHMAKSPHHAMNQAIGVVGGIAVIGAGASKSLRPPPRTSDARILRPPPTFGPQPEFVRGAPVEPVGTPRPLNAEAIKLLKPTSPAIRFDMHRLIDDPAQLWGLSAEEIAAEFNTHGFTAIIRQSTRGSGKAVIVEVKGHPEVAQIQVHPGGGRHEGSYVKLSTNKGILKVVDPKTYKPTEGEKAKIIFAPQ